MTTATLILLIVVAVIILVIINLASKAKSTCTDKAYIKNEWSDVLELSKDPKTRPMSIIRADKLLDQALKGNSYQGNTVGERLISAKYKLKSRNTIWNAHKLRNKITHEPLCEPSEKQIQKALEGYHKALKDLEAL